MADQTLPTDIARFETLATRIGAAQTALRHCVRGQEQVIEQMLVTMLAGGHGLIVGVPGIAKTTLVRALGHICGLHMQRIQFTPDLMPADILGSEILRTNSNGDRRFAFVPGPVFAQLVMADEINRASPRTQAALLEAMQEAQVTIAGETRPLPVPFHVFATQNPIEQDGTYPLPEAQLDRFLLQIDMGFPSAEVEAEVVTMTTGGAQNPPPAVLDAPTVQAMQALVRDMPLPADLLRSTIALVRAARPEAAPEQVQWGPGPRASQALALAMRARAFLHGRSAPILEDVLQLAPAILRHRLQLTYKARSAGVTTESFIRHLMSAL
jgi:MoxR-like ATPase